MTVCSLATLTGTLGVSVTCYDQTSREATQRRGTVKQQTTPETSIKTSNSDTRIRSFHSRTLTRKTAWGSVILCTTIIILQQCDQNVLYGPVFFSLFFFVCAGTKLTRRYGGSEC